MFTFLAFLQDYLFTFALELCKLIMYHARIIDNYLLEWSKKDTHKPLLLRGARQVGKSTAVRHLGETFNNYVEINFEKMSSYKKLFEGDIDIKKIISQISVIYGKQIIPGKTLLFLDEIQDCTDALRSLRYFKEDIPELHVIAAGSLLEFALDDIPTFGVARIHSMFMFPMTFDEFLLANDQELLLKIRKSANADKPLPEPLYDKILDLFRTYLLVGGMPESVAKWVETRDFLQCQEVQDDIVVGYDADFPKYKKKVDPELLRQTLKSVVRQVGSNKFKASDVQGYKSKEVNSALELLTKAGLIVPVTHSDANGLPLGSEENKGCRKYLLLDTGLLLRMQNLQLQNMSSAAQFILTSTATELVNKGNLAEMIAGLELIRYLEPNVKHELYYWLRQAKNAIAELDYISVFDSHVLPIEVKADTQGGMKSLWAFMRQRKLKLAVRCSLENFGSFDYVDTFENDKQEVITEVRKVVICPLFAMAQIMDGIRTNYGLGV